jgi:hypothetical protein
MAIKRKTRKAPPKTGILAAPYTSFNDLNNYLRTETDRKDVAGVIRNQIRQDYTGDKQKLMLNAPEYFYHFNALPATVILWKQKGLDQPTGWNFDAIMFKFYNEVETAAHKKLDEPKSPRGTIRTPHELMKEKTSNFIAEVEYLIDLYPHQPSFNMYNEMTLVSLAAVSARVVFDYYERLLDELRELVEKKTPDLVEAYSHLTVKERKAYYEFIRELVSDAKKYILAKKATRAIRTPRVKTADRQVAKLQYAKTSDEFKLTSINPMAIVGSMRLYVFNTKTRTVSEYLTQSSKGFQMKGTTLQGWDKERSRQTRLRKPEEGLNMIQTKTPTAIGKWWTTLTTKTNSCNGRINNDTILLRVFDR